MFSHFYLQVNPAAKAGFTIATLVLEVSFIYHHVNVVKGLTLACCSKQQVTKIPAKYKELKDATNDCIQNIEFTESARKVFKTPRVRNLLSSIMDMVISALHFISRYYSKSAICEQSIN